MKKLTWIVVAMVSWYVVQARAEQEIVYKDVAVSVMDTYVPSSLKGDQQGYVVANGLFPNSCYELSRSEVNHQTAFDHEIRIIARVRSGVCLRELVHYNMEVGMGVLKRGTHKLSFVADDGTVYEKIFKLE